MNGAKPTNYAAITILACLVMLAMFYVAFRYELHFAKIGRAWVFTAVERGEASAVGEPRPDAP